MGAGFTSTRPDSGGARHRTARIAGLAGAGLVAASLGMVVPAAGVTDRVADFDFDGDGFAELVLGVPGENLGTIRDAGLVNVLRGSPLGPTVTGNRTWTQASSGVTGRAEAGDMLGAALASGDFDHDGFADLAIGVPGEVVGTGSPILARGAVQVLYGSSAGLGADRDQLWYAGAAGLPALAPGSGFGVLAAGDFDGNGFDDLAIGVPGARVSGVTEAGQVLVLRGSSAGLTATGAQTWDQTSPGVASEPEQPPENWAGESFGAALAAGDVNADGRDDLAIGVPYEDRGVGAVEVLLGSAGGLTSSGAQYLSGAGLDPAEPAVMDGYARVLALADVDADGRADLVAGRSEALLGSSAKSGGRVAVVHAGPSGAFDLASAQDWNLETSGLPGARTTWSWFGTSVAAGDLTGDGVADLAIGASGSGAAGKGADGAVYTLVGSAKGLTPTNLQLSQDTPGVPGVSESYDEFGTNSLAILSLGSGPAQWLVVGTPQESFGSHNQAGTVTVVPGSPTGLDPARSRVWNQSTAGVVGAAEGGDHLGCVSGGGCR